MTDKIKYSIITPEKVVVEGSIEMIVVPGEMGDIGCLLGHMPLISSLRPGAVCLFENSSVISHYYVSGGVAEITADNCVILADSAEKLTDIDTVTLEVSKSHASDDHVAKVEIIQDLINNPPYT